MTIFTSSSSLEKAPLGKKSEYIDHYTPDLLFAIPRKLKRSELSIEGKLPFRGFDVWNAFEISWLNPKGKPIVAVAEIQFPCESPYLIESKSLKLYLNSFNNSMFNSFEDVAKAMKTDLTKAAGNPVGVKLMEVTDAANLKIASLSGECLDTLDIDCNRYLPHVDFLTISNTTVQETLYTNLLKSNCLVTGQPDWGSVQIKYEGKKINHEGLLRYIVSLRNHNEFHEQCVERIFKDILIQCRPDKLSVYARYTRRGGLDINPYRTNFPDAGKNEFENIRLVRQ